MNFFALKNMGIFFEKMRFLFGGVENFFKNRLNKQNK